MATTITPEIVNFVRESLLKHGFEHALQRASVDCVMHGIDADDYTYCVVALFTTFILARSMESHTQLDAKFVTLQGNLKAIVQTVTACGAQLAKQLDAAAAEEAARQEQKPAPEVTH